MTGVMQTIYIKIASVSTAILNSGETICTLEMALEKQKRNPQIDLLLLCSGSFVQSLRSHSRASTLC
jgi:hypothetical protein